MKTIHCTHKVKEYFIAQIDISSSDIAYYHFILTLNSHRIFNKWVVAGQYTHLHKHTHIYTHTQKCESTQVFLCILLNHQKFVDITLLFKIC